MSDESSDKKAWLWYDVSTLEIRHIGFKRESDHGVGLGILPIHFQLAADLVGGKHKLIDFEVVKKDQNVVLRRKKVLHAKPKFWQLLDPEAAARTTAFGSSEDANIPVRISDKTYNSFKVDVFSNAKNIQFYITMRNDPNYLIKTIDLYPSAFDAGTAQGIEIPVDLGHDYSIYVKYDAA